MWIELTILIGICGYLFYRWATVNNDFWKKRGMPYDEPAFMLGSLKEAIFRKKSFWQLVRDIYDKSDKQVFGIFDQRSPLLAIRDPKLIRMIAVKDFDHFINHRDVLSDPDSNSLFSNSLILLKDSKWKDMRSTLTPVFSGLKMRNMFQFINVVAKNTIDYLHKQSNEATIECEMDIKDLCTRYANDIIASAAYGLHVDSFENPKNEFYEMGKKALTFTAWRNMVFFFFSLFKGLRRLFKVEFFPQNIQDYFFKLVVATMKYRKEHNIHRPDMINMMMEARGMIESDYVKPHNREWSDLELAAQSFVFLFGGFETSSTLMCTAAHELMENPDAQQTLYEEIEDVLQKLDGGELTYDALQNMKYMDMVVSETLRKWPPLVATDRVCSKDITYELDDGSKLEIQKGDFIWLPTAGLHYDPQYFPDPEKFDPERFNTDNKQQIEPYAYMPFGVGPRHCIGSRFALMESKALLFNILKDFRIEASRKSCIPLRMTSKTFQMVPENGYWLKFVPRK